MKLEIATKTPVKGVGFCIKFNAFWSDADF